LCRGFEPRSLEEHSFPLPPPLDQKRQNIYGALFAVQDQSLQDNYMKTSAKAERVGSQYMAKQQLCLSLREDVVTLKDKIKKLKEDKKLDCFRSGSDIFKIVDEHMILTNSYWLTHHVQADTPDPSTWTTHNCEIVLANHDVQCFHFKIKVPFLCGIYPSVWQGTESWVARASITIPGRKIFAREIANLKGILAEKEVQQATETELLHGLEEELTNDRNYANGLKKKMDTIRSLLHLFSSSTFGLHKLNVLLPLLSMGTTQILKLYEPEPSEEPLLEPDQVPFCEPLFVN